MSPLEEAAREWVNEEYWKDPTRPVKVTDSLTEKVFIAGALWLLEKAQNQSFTIGANHPTENRWVSLTRLREVCQSKEE